MQKGAVGCRGSVATLDIESMPLTSRACTPRGTGELHPWREEAEELGRAPGLRGQELLPFSREKLQTRKGRLRSLRGEPLNPAFLLLLPRTCPSTVKGSEVQAGQVLRRKV